MSIVSEVDLTDRDWRQRSRGMKLVGLGATGASHITALPFSEMQSMLNDVCEEAH